MPSQTENFQSLGASAATDLVLLLKFARLYGPRHARTAAQLSDCWQKLESALVESEAGLTLSVARHDLLLDGVPLEPGATEQSFRQALTKAGITSVIFTSDFSRKSLQDFVRTYAEAAFRPALLRKRLDTLGKQPGSGIRAQMREPVSRNHPLAKRTVEPEAPSLTSSQKMLRLIADAERSARNPYEFGEEFLGRLHASDADSLHALSEDESLLFVRAVANAGAATEDARASEEWKEKFSKAPAAVRSALRKIFSEIEESDSLVQYGATPRLAGDMAIRYAAGRFERGHLKPAAVGGLLARLESEIENYAPAAGIPGNNVAGERAPETGLEGQFWASLSDSILRGVLSSAESWCVPAHLVRRRAEEILASGGEDYARKILSQYARGAANANPDARRKAAAGLAQMSELYVRTGEIDFVLHVLGAQMAIEREPELQKQLGATFVRFSQAAAQRRSFAAVNEALDRLANVEKEQPDWAASLRPRAGIVNRIPEFIEEGVKQREIREELAEALRKMPQASADYLASRLMHVASGTEREQIVQLARRIGNPGCEHLRQTFQSSPLASGSRALGLLSRLDAPFVDRLLPEKMLSTGPEGHDAALHQLSVAAAPERGRILMRVMDRFDCHIAPLALDEVGMCGDAGVAPELLRLAEGELLPDCSDFVRVKALEAVSRLHSADAVPQLMRFIEARRAWRWMYPQEMRVAAAQALVKIQPEYRAIAEDAGIESRLMEIVPLEARPERDFVRHRRCTRIAVPEPIPAVLQSKSGKLHPSVNVLSLDGGLLKGDFQLAAGTFAGLRISTGLRPIRLDVMVRFARGNQAGVETTGMDLDDRSRLRSLLASIAGPASAPAALPA